MPTSKDSGRLSQPSTQQAVIEIHIDEITNHEVSGWAWTPSTPNALIEVSAIVRSEVVGRTLARLPRPDIKSRGYNPAPRGFKIILGKTLTATDAISIRASAVDESERQPQTAPLVGDHSSVPLSLLDDHKRFTAPGPEFEDFSGDILKDIPASRLASAPILLAFYHPQFYAIPENNVYRGKGFTEWHHLSRGISRFPGHYQPRIPRDLGYYDPTHIDVIRAQVELARASRIGFAFYYFRLAGKRLLDEPLNRLLASDLDMPFVLLWSNEDWTGTWGGPRRASPLRQAYDGDEEEEFLEDFARSFTDKRYIRLDGGRPLLIIYNPSDVPEPQSTLRRWRQRLAKKCGMEPLIFMAQTFGLTDPRPLGFDGALEFPPNKVLERLPYRAPPNAYGSSFLGNIVSYDEMVTDSLNEEDAGYPLIKTAVPSWDNDPRYPNCSLSLTDISPRKYEAWLRALIERAINKPIFGSSIVAINAWNEWTEGAYLEPDIHFGSAFLNATARAYRSAVLGATTQEQELSAPQT